MSINATGNISNYSTTNDYSNNTESTSNETKHSVSNINAQSQQEEKSMAKPHSEDEIKKAVNDMNHKMVNAEAVFGKHDETGRTTIKLVNKSTKEVIKEFPSDKALDMLAKLWEMAGIIVDEKR